jgi:hypothetical protein
VLVGTLHNLAVDWHLSKRGLVIANKAQTLQIIGRKEPSYRSWVCQPNFPEELMQAVCLKTERRDFLLGGYLIDVLAELLFTLTRIARCPFRFDHRKDCVVRMVE